MSEPTTTGVESGSAEATVHAVAVTSGEFSKIKLLNWLVGDYEFDRYGIYAIALIVTGILAGIAVGLGAMTSPVSIIVLIVPTMASLVMIIGVAPMKLLLWTVFVTCIIDIIMIIAMLAVWGEPISTLF